MPETAVKNQTFPGLRLKGLSFAAKGKVASVPRSRLQFRIEQDFAPA